MVFEKVMKAVPLPSLPQDSEARSKQLNNQGSAFLIKSKALQKM